VSGTDAATAVPLRRPDAGGPRARARGPWARPGRLIPAVAAVVALLTVGVLTLERALGPDGTSYAAAGGPLAPGATGDVDVLRTGAGFSVVIEADGLPAAAPGSYYAAWLRGPKGVVPLGSFHERATGWAVELWSGVDPAAYPALEVTLQAEGAPPAPSERVVLTASLRS
jgi:hypothetical protein